MSNIVKKSFHIFMAVAIVIWTLSPLSILTTKTAQAAVSMYGSGGGSDPFYYIPPMGQVLPASSGYTGLFSFHLQKVSGDSITLSSVKVTLTSGGSGTLAANDIAGLAVFKRTSWDSGMYTFPGADNIGEIDNLSDGSGGNITIGANTIPVTSGAIPTNSFDAEYYVAVKTSSNWSGTDRVTYDVPTNWVTLSNSNTLGSACTTNPTYCQPDGDVYYATAPSDWSGTSFMVENVEYMGTMEDGTQEVEVRFTNDYDSGASAANNATNASNYNISGTNPNSVMQYGPMSVGLSFGSGVTINPNSTQLTIDKDIQDIMGNVLDDTSNIDFIITGAGSGGGASSPLYISEVSIGTANGGLEEFIEFYNPDSANALDFTAMPLYIWAATSSGSSRG